MSNDFNSRYRERTPESEKLYEEASEILPDGIGGSSPPHEPYPFFVDRAKGSKILDEDGNEYIDFNLCWGVLMVGHSHPKLVEGLVEQLDRGTIYGFPHEGSTEAAKKIKDRFPVDKVRFTNSGSESTLYAVRLARRFTGKDKILKIEGGYNGVADPLHVSKMPPEGKIGPEKRPSQIPHGDGITESTVEDTLVAPFNDIETTRDILEDNMGEVAALIVEPVMMNKGVIPPEEGYLQELRELTREHNVLLIFDEVKTGVKVAPGGASDYYGVKPDLITLAKAIGGGLPIGACAGRAEIMEGIGKEGLFGTYSANPLSIKACNITLGEILTEKAYRKLEELGEKLTSGYDDIIEDHGLKARTQSVNAVGGPLFTDEPVRNFREWCSVDEEKAHEYWISMVNKGIIPMSYGADEEWLISVQHTQDDIEEHLEKFKEVALELSDR